MNHQLPDIFLKRLALLLPPEQAAECLKSFSLQRPVGFRINTLKCPVAEVLAELETAQFDVQPVAWLSTAYTVPASKRRLLSTSNAFNEGRLYIQGLSSMLAPLLLAPEPGEEVLDLAAAPGGKTLQMAAMMQGLGRLAAVEPVKSRFFRLKANLERGGAANVHLDMKDGRGVGAKVPGRFDRVLLDAPCSSEARFTASDPNSWAHWSLKKVKESARKQKRLLDSAIRSLKPGGKVLYCTCSFAPEENEQVIDSQLKRYGDELEVIPLPIELPNLQPGLGHWLKRSYSPQLKHAVRVLPDATMAAFFLCLLRRNA